MDGDPDTWDERGRPTKTVNGPKTYLIPVQTLAEAHGVAFLCPKCFTANGGPVGTHECHVDFNVPGIPSDADTMKQRDGSPVRWAVSGTGFEDLTTQPSILLLAGCGWHGFITKAK